MENPVTILGIDHIIVIGHQLETMISGFEQLGFTVTPGGRHSTGTHNALIALGDGAYIELLAFWEPALQSRRWWMLQAGGGLCEFMLTSDDIDLDVESIRKRGISYDDSVSGSRTRPDGQVVKWKDGPSPEHSSLPYLIEDVTARELRIPDGEARIHPNGATGIKQLLIRSNCLHRTAEQYHQILGRSPDTVHSTTNNIDSREWQFNRQRLTIFQAASNDGSDVKSVELQHGAYRCVLFGSGEMRLDPGLACDAHLKIEAG